MTFSKSAMNPHYFESPTKFMPERWLQSPEKTLELEKYSLAFGRGNRMCIGMK